MKKLLLCAAFLLLIFGASASLEAAESQALAPLTPAVQAVAPPEAAPGEQGAEPTDILALSPMSSAEVKLPPPPMCMNYIACYQTPEGCGCAGYYCNGLFICGTPLRW